MTAKIAAAPTHAPRSGHGAATAENATNRISLSVP